MDCNSPGFSVHGIFQARILLPEGSAVKKVPAIQERHVPSLGQEDPLKEDMVTHSSIPGWEIPRTEEPSGLPSMGSQRVGHD